MKNTISIRMVHVLAVILFAGATLVDSEPCPSAAEISPCVCHGDTDVKDVICEDMTTNDNLLKAFGASNFKEPIPKLVIYNLKSSVLPDYVLGDTEVIDLEFLDGNIAYIAYRAFKPLPLMSLRLDNIGLEYIPPAIENNPVLQLKTLSMTGNVLKKLGHRSLRSLLKVQVLGLSGNQISEIDPTSLPENVQSLWISHNKLTTFNNSLHNMKNLKHLDASFNELTTMKGEFEGVSGLTWLNLDYNQISDISDSFSDLPSLRELSLGRNEIREIRELADLSNLLYLNLAENDITNLNRRVFENLVDLDELNLSGNLLTAFQICPTLVPLRSLRRITMQYLNMSTIPADCFHNNTDLVSVDLKWNKLSALGLTNARSLVYLDISYNKFRSLKNLDLPEAGVARLVLEHNQWLCSSETTSLLNGLYMRGYYFPDGYPSCLPIDEKPQTCISYEYR